MKFRPKAYEKGFAKGLEHAQKGKKKNLKVENQKTLLIEYNEHFNSYVIGYHDGYHNGLKNVTQNHPQ